MTLRGIELIMARKQVDALIKADPVMVTLRRRTQISQPDGGWVWSDYVPLRPQQVCMIPFKRRMTQFLVNTELGNLPDLPYIILGRHHMNIKRDDLFQWNGQEFQVQTLDIGEPEVKAAAQVDYFAGEKLNG